MFISVIQEDKKEAQWDSGLTLTNDCQTNWN